MKAREQVADTVSRGKLECQLRLQADGEQPSGLQVDAERLEAVLQAADQVRQALPDARPLDPLSVLQFPGVCRAPETDEEAIQASASALFACALESLAANRAREGGKLALFIRERLELLTRETQAVREKMPELRRHQRERLLARLADLAASFERQDKELERGYGDCGSDPRSHR